MLSFETETGPAVRSSMELERFDYSRVGSDWALMRMLTSLRAGLGAPAGAELVVRSGEPAQGAGVSRTPRFPARACALERRLFGQPGRPAASGTELLWRASFVVPLEIVEFRESVFELAVADGVVLTLPAPGLRLIAPRRLTVSAPRPSLASSPLRPGAGQARQRIAAVATAVAVSTTSVPAVALAAGVTSALPSTPSGQSAPAPPSPASPTSAASATSATTPSSSSAPTTTRPIAEPAAVASPSHRHVIAPAPAPTAVAKAVHSPATRPPPAIRRSSVNGRSAGHTGARGAVMHFSAPVVSIPDRRPGAVQIPVPTCSSSTETKSGGPKAVMAEQRAAARRLSAARADSRLGCNTPVHRKAPGPHRAASKSHPRQGARFVVGQPGLAHDHSSVPGSAKHGDGLKPSSRHPATLHPRPTGGAPIQPLGGFSRRSAVKLQSHPAASTSSTSALSSSAPGFLGPPSWTGTVTTDPALTGAVSDLSGLLTNGNRPPSFLIPIYMQAGHRYGVPWEVLAAINAIESDYGRDLSTSSAGAMGWMQFEPSTWRQYGVAADGHSVPNPYDPRDAIFSAARYLAAAGAGENVARAVYAYNHASWYVDEVLSRAQSIAHHAQFERQAVRHGVFSVYFATGVKRHPMVRYRGSVLSHYDRLIAAANMVSAANFPYLYGGGHEQPARFGPFDCSGSVSYVMQQAGYKVPTTVSGDIPSWRFPAGPGRVTIFYNPVHTYMRIGNRYFGTSGFARPGGGAGWFDVNRLPVDYLSQFHEVHVPRLGINSFAPASRHGRARD